MEKSRTAETVLDPVFYQSEHPVRVNNFTGSDMTVDTFYFDNGQALNYQRDENSDQVLFVMQGDGHVYLDNGSEQVIDVTSGSIVYVPAGVWYRWENGNDKMIVSVCRPAGSTGTMRL